MHHPLGHFVDGPVPTGGYHQVGAAPNMFARNAARRRGAGGGCYRDVMACFLEDLNCALQQRGVTAAKFSRAWIVDQDGIPVGCDEYPPGPSFKL
jgi:hypothetical protein